MLKRGAADKVLWSQVSSLWSTLLLHCTTTHLECTLVECHSCVWKEMRAIAPTRKARRTGERGNGTDRQMCKLNIIVPGVYHHLTQVIHSTEETEDLYVYMWVYSQSYLQCPSLPSVYSNQRYNSRRQGCTVHTTGRHPEYLKCCLRYKSKRQCLDELHKYYCVKTTFISLQCPGNEEL